MSGIKSSPIDFEREKKLCNEAIAEIKSHQRSLKGMGKRMAALLASMPEGVKKSFAGQIQAAGIWLEKGDREYNASMASDSLQAIARSCKKRVEQGLQLHDELIDIVENKRQQKAKDLLKKFSSLQAGIEGDKELLDKWKPGENKRMMAKIIPLADAIRNGDFLQAEQTLKKVFLAEKEMRIAAGRLEQQDRERHIVADALVEVCKDMGWRLEGEIALEDDADPASDLLLSVQTYSAGMMDFRLSLEGISVHSPISSQGRVCHQDFDTVSDKLKNFGVKAQFEQVHPIHDDPELRQQGEADLPGPSVAAAMEMKR